MHSRTEKTLTIAGALGAVAFSVLAVWYWQRGAAPDIAAAVPAAPTWDWLIGPGVPRGELPPLDASLGATRAPGLALDAGGHLVAGIELRKLMDSYLARGPLAERPARAQQLQAFLKRELVAPAAAEAQRIALEYLQYLEAEERALAREGFSAPAQQLSERDVQRLQAYGEQRAQRRERMLGPALARAWFDADDSRCVAALREWQVQHVAPEPGRELDFVEIRERRIHGAVLEARRDADAQACAVQMSRADGGG